MCGTAVSAASSSSLLHIVAERELEESCYFSLILSVVVKIILTNPIKMYATFDGTVGATSPIINIRNHYCIAERELEESCYCL